VFGEIDVPLCQARLLYWHHWSVIGIVHAVINSAALVAGSNRAIGQDR
jgi:hypothetical protein